jgi:hypothetical protein
MRIGAKVVAWVLAVVAAGAIVGGAYLFGIDRGLFSPGREDEVGRLLLADDQVQRAIAAATVEALVDQVSLAEAVRPRLEDAAFRVTQTDRYAELFQRAVDLAYARALNDGAASRSVVLTLDDVIELLGGDAITLLGGVDLGSLGDEGVELVGAGDLRRIRKTQEAAHRWALPLLSLGIVLAIAAVALPGRRSTRGVWLGGFIAAGAAALFFTMGEVGARLAERSSQPAQGVVEALWASAAPSIRTWLGSAFMGGLLVVAVSLLVSANDD